MRGVIEVTFFKKTTPSMTFCHVFALAVTWLNIALLAKSKTFATLKRKNRNKNYGKSPPKKLPIFFENQEYSKNQSSGQSDRYANVGI